MGNGDGRLDTVFSVPRHEFHRSNPPGIAQNLAKAIAAEHRHDRRLWRRLEARSQLNLGVDQPNVGGVKPKMHAVALAEGGRLRCTYGKDRPNRRC